jgi:hypothetical protein
MSRADRSFPFSLSNVGYVSTFDSENGASWGLGRD